MCNANGKFMIQAGAGDSNGPTLSVPRTDSIEPREIFCKAGPSSELPPLNLRHLGVLNLWSVSFDEHQ